MNEALHHWYRETRESLKEAEKSSDGSDEMLETIKEWKEAIKIMETGSPDLKSVYERRVAMQESFTPEQVDFICYQIGDWYLQWKHNIIVDGEKNQHRLGYAKEQLKTILCGG